MIDNANTDTGSLSRREREKLAHRQEIMDAALKLFGEKGYHGTTLDDIAQQAEFSKGTLYLYFSSKEDLLYSIILEKTEERMIFYKKILDQNLPIKEEVRRVFHDNAEYAFSNENLFNIHVFHHLPAFKALSPERVAEFEERHRMFDKIAIDRVRYAIKKGELRDVCPECVYGLFHGVMENMVMSRWDTESVDELKRYVDNIIDIMFNGIAKERETAQ